MFRNVKTLTAGEDAGKLLEVFSAGMVGIVVDDSERLMGIVTKMDLVDVLTARTGGR